MTTDRIEVLELNEIKNEQVGYRLRESTIGGTKTVEKITVDDFIAPYAFGAKDPSEVYRNLESALHDSRRYQDSVAGGKRPVMLDVLASATLEREAIMNSMQLIRANYRL